MDNLGPLFDEAIEQGRAVILLDGLDEVQRHRSNLVQKVEAFAHEAMAARQQARRDQPRRRLPRSAAESQRLDAVHAARFRSRRD